MLFVEFIIRILPSLFTVLIMEELIKIDKYEKTYIFFILCLLSNVFVYFVFQNLGFSMIFTVSFAFKLSIALFFTNIFFMYLFTLVSMSNKKRKTRRVKK